MRRSNRIFSNAERRFAVVATVAVVTVAALTVFMGGLFDPPLGSAAHRGVTDIPGVMDAKPLS